MFFLNGLFDKTKRHFINIFLFCRKDNLKKTFFRHFLDIFLLCQKDGLKNIFFSHLLVILVFCAIWN